MNRTNRMNVQPGKPVPRMDGTSGPPSRSSRVLIGVIFALLALFFLALSITPLSNNDIWLHLANGRAILETGRISTVDQYSFTAEGNPYHAHEWLAGVIFYLIYKLAGVNGLILFKTMLCGAAFLFSAVAARRLGAGLFSIASCTGLALVIANSRFLERPDLFSFALAGFYLWILAGEERRMENGPDRKESRVTAIRPSFLRASRIWILVPFQWFWAQTHGYFLVGLVLVALFLAGRIIPNLVPGGEGKSIRRDSPRLVSGFAALAFMALIGLIHPNGIEVYAYPFRLVSGETAFTQTVYEWKPTFTTASVVRSSMFLGFCAWISLAIVGLATPFRLLRRPVAWRLVSLASLGLLLWKRLSLSRSGEVISGGLPGSVWLQSPAEWLARLFLEPHVERVFDPLHALFHAIGGFAGDLLSLLILLLLFITLLYRRAPDAAGKAWAVVALTFLLLTAGPAALVYLVCILGSVLAASIIRRVLPIWPGLIFIFFLIMAVKQNRDMATFSIVSLPFLAAALTKARMRHSPDRLARTLPGAALTAALFAGLLLAVTIGWPYTPDALKRTGLGTRKNVPARAVEYITRNDIRGCVFNKYTYGAYLAFHLFPETRVFIDSRGGTVYAPDLYTTYRNARDDEEEAARLFAVEVFDYVLFDYSLFSPRSSTSGLLSFLARSPEWRLVYFDDESVLYLPVREDNIDRIRRDGYRILDPVHYRPGLAGRMNKEQLDHFGMETAIALNRFPECNAARVMRADFLIESQRFEEAVSLLDMAIRDDPRNTFALIMGVSAYESMGNRDRGNYLNHKARLVDPKPACRRTKTD